MKFVFITPWYGMFAGGFEVEFRCYAETLAQAGYPVEVLTTCSQSPYHSWQEDYFASGAEIINGVTVKRFKTNKDNRDKYLHAEQTAQNNPPLPIQYDFFSYGINSDELVNSISQYNDDCILVCGPYFQSLSYKVLTTHPGKIYLRPALHNEIQVSWQPVRDMLVASKGLLLATEAEKNVAIKFHGKAVGRNIIEAPVIGVPVNIAPRFTDTAVIHRRYNLPAHYFLYVGRKEIGKGINRLVSWYKYYLNECQNEHHSAIPLVFIGGGPSHLIPKHAAFIDLGFVPEADKHGIIAGAEALINLSANESFSFVLMEAWAQHTPVIVFADCGATSEHCLKSGGGFVTDSPINFHQALRHIEDKETQLAMGKDGKEYLIAHYPMSKVFDNFLIAVSS